MEIKHNPSYLFLSQEDEDDVRDIGKHDFRWALLHPVLCNANRKSEICLLFGRWRSGYQNKFLFAVRPRAEIGQVAVYFCEVRGYELKNVSLMFFKM